MKNHRSILWTLVVFYVFATPQFAAAADCAGQARAAASSLNAEVLNVVDLGDGNCEATFRIPGKDGTPPRVVTKKLKG